MRRSTIDAFFETAARYKSQVALRYKVGGTWRETTWEGYARDVRRVGRALVALGVPSGGRVAIIGPNKPEWLIADLGTIAAGAVPAPIYPSCTAEQVAYVASHSESTVAVVHNAEQLQKFRAEKEKLPGLKHFVLMDGERGSLGDDVLSWSEFLAKGDAVAEEELDKRLKAIESKGLATLIYTSGTTGPPKAVMISHGNLIFVAEAMLRDIGLGPQDHSLSYLPLSHIAEQMLSIHIPVTVGSTLSFCEDLNQLGDYLREVHPTVFLGVPRVWEKIQGKMVEAGASAPPLRKKIVGWARKVGLAANRARQKGQSPPWTYGIAKKLVFSKVRERLGLERARFLATAAAPIAKSTLEFFLALDMPLYEIYGMSECTGPGTMSRPDQYRTGTVGQVFEGAELKIAEDGEICMRGPHVFLGYLKDEAATKETIDAEGWLHSGDVGEFDDKFVRITDRKKDLIITAGGKNIAPQNLEALLKGVPGVAQAVVIGDRRKYLVALVTLDPEAAVREAQKCGARGKTVAELAEDRAFIAHVEAGVKQVNATLASYESIKKFKILPTEFTIESGELTPTMKVKRKVVNERYKDAIEGLYAGEEGAAAAS